MKFPFPAVLYALLISVAPLDCVALDEGQQAPAISLPSLAGAQVTLEDFKGKVVYLDFWASWCGPCKHTLPWMESLQRKFGPRGLQVLAVNLDVNADKAAAALEEINPTFLVLHDAEKKAVGVYTPPKMPTSFLIDRTGKIVFIHPGFHPGEEQELEQRIEALLANQSEGRK